MTSTGLEGGLSVAPGPVEPRQFPELRPSLERCQRVQALLILTVNVKCRELFVNFDLGEILLVSISTGMTSQ